MTSSHPLRPSYDPDSRWFALVLTYVPDHAIASVRETLGTETTVYPALVARRLTSQEAETAAAQLRALGAVVEIWDETPPLPEGSTTLSDPERVLISSQLPNTFVIIIRAGDKKIQLIKEVRSVTSLGLKEAKDLVDDVPSILGPFQAREAIEVYELLQTTGAECEIVGLSESTDAQVFDVLLTQCPVQEPDVWPAVLQRISKACPSGKFPNEPAIIAARINGYIAERIIQMVEGVGGTAVTLPSGQINE